MARLDILLSTYNGEKYLVEQVDSVIGQSFEDWRLLVCDDGSGDRTPDLIRDIAAKDPRIVLFASSGNVGQKARLKFLLDQTAGELVGFADQDDVWHTDKLRKLVDAIDDADMAFGSSMLIDGGGRSLDRNLVDSFPPRPARGDRLTMLLRPVVSAHSLVMRRNLVVGSHSFFRKEPFDHLLSLESAFRRGVEYISDAITFHRMHETNQMNGWAIHDEKKTPLISRYELNHVVSYVVQYRFALMSRMEHLMFSSAVDLETANTLKKAYELCRKAWFARPLFDGKAWTHHADLILDCLIPLAGSERDADFARRRLRGLCEPSLSLARFASRWKDRNEQVGRDGGRILSPLLRGLSAGRKT